MDRSTEGSPAFELRGLTKLFHRKTAVDHLDLVVPAGSLFGMVGPNGAGKTTSISMGVGLLRPDAGSAFIHGVDVWNDPQRARALVGVLPDNLAMPERLTGREALTYLGSLRGMGAGEIERRADNLLGVLGLAGDEQTLITEYSAGMRKKIGLAIALLHRPRLLVLDEPFESVDPVSAITIRAILTQFIDGGGTIVLSSHVMALVEQLCDYVGIIAAGKVVASGRLAEVQDGLTLEARFVELVGASAASVEELAWLNR